MSDEAKKQGQRPDQAGDAEISAEDLKQVVGGTGNVTMNESVKLNEAKGRTTNHALDGYIKG